MDNPWVIAIATTGERVIGTCDISLRRRVQDHAAVGIRIFSAIKGVDPQDDVFAYVENVCVDVDYRCQGRVAVSETRREVAWSTLLCLLSLVSSCCRTTAGIGRSLIDACMAEADTWGVDATYTEVELSNEHAYGLYTKCGFEAPEKTRRAIQAMTPDTPRVGKFVVLRRSNSANS